MGRGAPNKPGLTYFPKMLDFYEDDKIFDLLDRFGPLGVTIYDCILCIVYKNGYYAEIPLDKLSRMIIKMIGNKWVKNQKAVVQVVHFCSEIGLLDDDLMTKNIITSVGIQRRYYEIAVKRMKRQLYSKEYWLLGEKETEKPFLSAALNRISSEEIQNTSEEIQNTLEESAIEIKENKNKVYKSVFDDTNLENAFQLYLVVREKNWGAISNEQIEAMREELISMSSDNAERLAIVKKATASGWKNLYPLKAKKAGNKKQDKADSKFRNFEERDYDMDKLTEELLKS